MTGPAAGAGVPRWFAALLLAGAGGVGAAASAALALAVAGAYWWPAAVLAGVAGTAAGAAFGWRLVPPGAGVDARWAAGAVALAIVFVAANAGTLGGSVVLERDPGLYTNTARWIAGEGSLAVDARVGPFADAPGLTFVSVGMYDLDGTTLEFQANHLTPALYATGYAVGGVRGMQALPLLVTAGGLLAVFALAVRITGRGWAALAATAALAMTVPVLAIARDTLSEPLVLLLLWTGLWLWTAAADAGSRPAAFAAGLALGLCVAARIDAAAYLVPVPLAVVAWSRRSGWHLARPLLLGAVPGAVLAVLDVGLRSRGYLRDLDAEVSLLYTALGLSGMLAAVAARRRPLRAPAWWGTVLPAAVAVVLLAAWFVRPEIQRALGTDSPLVAAIQRFQGDGVDGRRRYHELSMVWQAWYLGPVVLAAAVAGAAVLTARLASGRDRALLLPLAALGAGTALYLFRPAISPDQWWAMRRFVPAGLPLWGVLAAAVAAGAVERVPRRGRAAVAAVLVVAALAPIAVRTWPVRAFREQGGFDALAARTCAVVGPDAAVVLPEGSQVARTLTQTIRSWCGVPAAIASPGADLPALADAWAREGRSLWVVADVVRQLPEGEVVVVGEFVNDRQLEKTLTAPPDGYETFRYGLVAARVAGG